jgi:acyl carrier protein
MKTIREQIYDLAVSTLEIPRERIQADARFSSYKVDSLALVEFIFGVQEHFHVDFDTDDFDVFKTLNDLVAAVELKVGSGSDGKAI